MRVLVVEDDRLLAEGLVRQLEKAGFSVDHTPSAREATVLGEQEDYRAVILDLGLPDGNNTHGPDHQILRGSLLDQIHDPFSSTSPSNCSRDHIL